VPSRPGDLAGPGEVPWGGAFGTPGPDTGYALRLVASRAWALEPAEDRHDVEAAAAALMAARASHCGRAPVVADAEVAELLLGLSPDAEAAPSLAGRRARVLPGIAHRAAALRALVASVDAAVLVAAPIEVADRIAAGEDVFVT
jgi:hypothetical protein